MAREATWPAARQRSPARWLVRNWPGFPRTRLSADRSIVADHATDADHCLRRALVPSPCRPARRRIRRVRRADRRPPRGPPPFLRRCPRHSLPTLSRPRPLRRLFPSACRSMPTRAWQVLLSFSSGHRCTSLTTRSLPVPCITRSLTHASCGSCSTYLAVVLNLPLASLHSWSRIAPYHRSAMSCVLTSLGFAQLAVGSLGVGRQLLAADNVRMPPMPRTAPRLPTIA